MIENNSEFFAAVKSLVEAWCDRKSLGALRRVLQAYPMTSGLTDEWGELAIAIENVRAFAREEITERELRSLEDAIAYARKIVGRF